MTNLEELANFKENRKLSQIFMETAVDKYNWCWRCRFFKYKVVNNEIRDLVMVSEALHEKKIAQIADMIDNKKGTKVVLMPALVSEKQLLLIGLQFSLKLMVILLFQFL